MPHIYSSFIRKPAWRLSLLIIADLLMFGATNARSITSYLLITGFLLLVATIYQTIRVLLAAAKLYGVHIKRSRRLAAGLTGLISFLVALQSVGELSPRDALVLLPLVMFGYLYSFYAEPSIIKPKQPV